MCDEGFYTMFGATQTSQRCVARPQPPDGFASSYNISSPDCGVIDSFWPDSVCGVYSIVLGECAHDDTTCVNTAVCDHSNDYGYEHDTRLTNCGRNYVGNHTRVSLCGGAPVYRKGDTNNVLYHDSLLGSELAGEMGLRADRWVVTDDFALWKCGGGSLSKLVAAHSPTNAAPDDTRLAWSYCAQRYYKCDSLGPFGYDVEVSVLPVL